jgi:multidrug resistance efflux pump
MTEIAVSGSKQRSKPSSPRKPPTIRLSDKAIAKLNLERSTVRAPVNGRLVNVSPLPDAYVATGQGVFALLDDDSLRVEGYLRKQSSAASRRAPS